MDGHGKMNIWPWREKGIDEWVDRWLSSKGVLMDGH